ncbi:MAG: hypothetical protein HOH48_00435 [Candidatus Puniceispirillum sp.]|jgi:hypothetical protein|uniref:hypothetical protein n=1 Tax=Candidatus Puniceispirillum sp. TaxID=2026719 RepID=UPI001EBD758E|nr:hypothetical protein [Candidatus Puniceispirillum sp.]MBT6414740.1 hypothetical protein [Candidatus Puniceispirillum sp.]MBT6567074.1 hypothetical protein [Candidatus Puniceispirillum sp.]
MTKIFMAILGVTVTLSAGAQALTFKSGEVLGPDGNMYVGASPENLENIIANAKDDDKPAGVIGNNVFVLVDDTITFVPTKDLAPLDDDERLELIGDKVVENISGVEGLTMDSIEAVKELGEEADIDLAKVISDGGLASLDKATLDDLQQVASETGIDLANIQAISDSLGGLDSQQLADMNAYLEESLEGELLDDINAEIAAISDIEGGMEALMRFNSYEDCVNGGGGVVCDEVDARLNELEGDDE